MDMGSRMLMEGIGAITFNSCEGDAGSYQTTLENLRNAARAAIRRVEGNAQP